MSAYADFLASKVRRDAETGITAFMDLPGGLFPFQADIVRWALKRGRAALFAGTGLGKSFMELAWADVVGRYTGRPVLHLAPLAVSTQIVREARKFGLQARLVRSQAETRPGANVTNYHKLDHFDPSEFGGIILDESSILKSETGKYRNKLVELCADIPFRLAATATPAPNDFMELGNHAEFLGVMSYTDMLSTFFVHDAGDTQKWRLKGHAEDEFWRWMASWAVMIRKPSDLGYENGGYDLPPLVQTQHRVAVPGLDGIPAKPAATLRERIVARRTSVAERVRAACALVPAGRPCIVWCNLNAEQDAFEASLGDRCISIRGSQDEPTKERLLLGWLAGDAPVIVIKPMMFGHGLNLQFCHDMIFVGLNDSFEQVYQAIRRCWRFGQTEPVNVHFVAAETEGAVVANLKRKEEDADRMAAAMVRHMAELSSRQVRGLIRDRPDYEPRTTMQMPAWLGAAA